MSFTITYTKSYGSNQSCNVSSAREKVVLKLFSHVTHTVTCYMFMYM